MPDSGKDFKPLVDAIEKVLHSLQGKTLPPNLTASDVDSLRKKCEEFKECCCQRAHVVKDRDDY